MNVETPSCGAGCERCSPSRASTCRCPEIPRRAGVSEPTLRRRFESKEALVAEAFNDKITTYADLAEAALENPDAWDGFVSFVTQQARMQLVDRGFAEC